MEQDEGSVNMKQNEKCDHIECDIYDLKNKHQPDRATFDYCTFREFQSMYFLNQYFYFYHSFLNKYLYFYQITFVYTRTHTRCSIHAPCRVSQFQSLSGLCSRSKLSTADTGVIHIPCFFA